MMEETEERLRRSLREHAACAPNGHQMLSRVRLESRRRRRQRRVTAAAVTAAAILLGGAFGASALTVDRTVRVPLGAPDTLVPGPPATISFPFTPQQALAGSSHAALTLTAGVLTLTYTGPDPRSAATVTVHRTPPEQVRPTPVSVRGHTGSTYLPRTTPGSTPVRILSWPERPDLWVEIRAPASETVRDLAAYADALRTEPMTQPLPFAFDLVPAALAMDNIDASAVTFAPAGIPASAGFDGRIAVMLEAAGATPPDGRPVAVPGRRGWLSESEGYTVLHIDNRDGRLLTVQMDNRVNLSQVDLIRFAAGIHIGATAQTGRG